MIKHLVVAVLIFFCCLTLFVIAFWRGDLNDVISISVSDSKNVFRCENRDSSSGLALLFNRCNFQTLY